MVTPPLAVYDSQLTKSRFCSVFLFPLSVLTALPAIHPGYGSSPSRGCFGITDETLLCTSGHDTAIPTVPHGGNHTRAFAKSAASPEGHAARRIETVVLDVFIRAPEI